MNGTFQIRFFWDSHWVEIRSNHFSPSMGPNGGSVAIKLAKTTFSHASYKSLEYTSIIMFEFTLCEFMTGYA
jgi:hypothetical protein